MIFITTRIAIALVIYLAAIAQAVAGGWSGGLLSAIIRALPYAFLAVLVDVSPEEKAAFSEWIDAETAKLKHVK